MRLWSLHPIYLDKQGLGALWREGLLAQKVLCGETKGYRHHPQLCRFMRAENSLVAIGSYLYVVAEEARNRGYHYDASKILMRGEAVHLPVTTGQLHYEWNHLKKKLLLRSSKEYETVKTIETPTPHPVFYVVPGKVENWERR